MKSQNEKKSAHEKKKENVTHEDAGEGSIVLFLSEAYSVKMFYSLIMSMNKIFIIFSYILSILNV